MEKKLTDTPTEPTERVSDDAKAPVLRVVRDSTFARGLADRGLVLDLGRDVEIAFLQIGPNLVSITDHGDAEGVTLDPVFTETSRIRLPWSGAIDVAMNILREGIVKGSVNIAAVTAAIDAMSSEIESKDENDASVAD